MGKTKRELRAEAVERLSNYEGWHEKEKERHEDPDLLMAVIGGDSWGCTWQENRNALIDLLTDDEPLEGDGTANGTTDGTCPNQIGQASNDTREKLEADVLDWAKHTNAVFIKSRVNRIIEFLDRQAAITRAECGGPSEVRAGSSCGNLGDAVSLMREHSLYEIGVMLHPNDRGKNTLAHLADMIERDYVRKDRMAVPDELVHAECHRLQELVDELTRQRNMAEADAKSQRNNFEQATGAREHWQKKAKAAEAERDELAARLDAIFEAVEKIVREYKGAGA